MLYIKGRVQVYSRISMHGCSALFPWRSAVTRAQPAHVNPTLDCAPGTHHCYVDLRLAQGFLLKTGAAGIDPQTSGSWVNTLTA